jgi:Trypsin-like peptidase domain
MFLRVVRARRLGALLAALAMSITVTGAIVPAQAAAPAYTLEERAVAVASPSLVYIEEIFTGYLRDRRTHAPVIASPITLGRRCSGFVVNADGYVATPASCVKPSDAAVRTGALYEATETLIKENKLDRGARDHYVTTNLPTTEFTGAEPGTQPQVQLYGQLNVATAATTDAPAIGGEVVATLEKSGDVAIVKLSQGNLPVAELQPQGTLDAGGSLVAIGYATSDPDSRTGTFTLNSKAVQVTGQGTVGKLQFTKINGDVGRFSNGGMAVDRSARVVGMLNNDWTQPTTPVRAVLPSSAIVEALGQTPVTNTLTPTDKLFRSGLDAYFRGDYKTAITQLGTVMKDAPSNRVAGAYRQQAEDRQKIEAGQSSGVPLWVWLAGAAAVGGLIAGLVTALIISSRRRRHEAADLLVPVSLNPFAPTSSMPFSAPPTSGAAPSTYQGTAIPHPAPPGVPVPLPPSVFPAGAHTPDAEVPDEPQPDEAPTEPSPPPPPLAPPAAPSTPPPSSPPPTFVWPDEEDNETLPVDQYPNTSNPWSPGAR